MKELALHILDIVKNSVAAEADEIDLTLTERADHTLTIVVADNGTGMSPEFLAEVTDPFTTTRTTRKVGMGLPLYRMAAEQTGGQMTIQSTQGVGTTVTAVFHRDHLDCPPMGDLPGTVALLIQGSPWVEFTLTHSTPKCGYEFTTQEIRAYLGDEISLSEPEVFLWLEDYLTELEQDV